MNMSLAKLKKFIKNRKGFLLVDSMVAVLILAIGLAALAFLYTNGIGTLHKASTREKAVQVAAERVELLKAKEGVTVNISDLTALETKANGQNTVTLDGETYTTHLTVDTTNIKSGTSATNVRTGDEYLFPVTVTVTWKNPDTQTITLKSYVVAKSS